MRTETGICPWNTIDSSSVKRASIETPFPLLPVMNGHGLNCPLRGVPGSLQAIGQIISVKVCLISIPLNGPQSFSSVSLATLLIGSLLMNMNSSTNESRRCRQSVEACWEGSSAEAISQSQRRARTLLDQRLEFRIDASLFPEAEAGVIGIGRYQEKEHRPECGGNSRVQKNARHTIEPSIMSGE